MPWSNHPVLTCVLIRLENNTGPVSPGSHTSISNTCTGAGGVTRSQSRLAQRRRGHLATTGCRAGAGAGYNDAAAGSAVVVTVMSRDAGGRQMQTRLQPAGLFRRRDLNINHSHRLGSWANSKPVAEAVALPAAAARAPAAQLAARRPAAAWSISSAGNSSAGSGSAGSILCPPPGS